MRCVRHGRVCAEPPTVLQCPTNGCRYLVRRLLGKGGFARVYRVAQLPPQQLLVNPTISSPNAQSPPSPKSPPLPNLSTHHDTPSFSPILPPPPPCSHASHKPTAYLPFDDASEHHEHYGPTRTRAEHGSLATASPSPTPTPTYAHYAMKVISKCRLGDSAAGHEALRNEVTIHQQLQHPAIVSLITYWEDEHRIYILMNLVDGPTLEEHVTARGRLTELEACLYTAQILEALSYLHANRIVHKDIKLANLLLSSDLKRVLLCDFGLSAHVDSQSHVHKSPVCGTPNYVAPELLVSTSSSAPSPKPRLFAQGTNPTKRSNASVKHVSYTSSADVWSTGVVLFMMVVGCGPFDSDDVSRTFRRIRTARYTFPIGIKVSATVKSIIRVLLAEDPLKRPTADQALRHAFFATSSAPRHMRRQLPAGVDNSRRIFYDRERHVPTNEDETPQRVMPDKSDDERNSPRAKQVHVSGMSGEWKACWSPAVESARRGDRPSAGGPNSAWSGRRRTSALSGQVGDEARARNYERRLGRPKYDRASSANGAQNAGRGVKEDHQIARTKLAAADGRKLNPRRLSSLALDFRKEVVKLSVDLSAGLPKGRQYLDQSGTTEIYRKVIRGVDGTKDAPPLVRRWLDYTSKYGFATLMEDGRIGCCFNDGSIMFFISEGADVPDVAYIAPATHEDVVQKGRSDGKQDGGPKDGRRDDCDKGRRKGCDVSKKACLCTLFADMMMDGERDCMYELPWACNVSFLKGGEGEVDEDDDMVHVREWARLKHVKAAGFRLSNHTIHVKFDVDEDLCDDYVFNMVDGTLFYRKGKQNRMAVVCDMNDIGEFSSLSEDVHAQLVVCGQMINRFLG